MDLGFGRARALVGGASRGPGATIGRRADAIGAIGAVASYVSGAILPVDGGMIRALP